MADADDLLQRARKALRDAVKALRDARKGKGQCIDCGALAGDRKPGVPYLRCLKHRKKINAARSRNAA